jgi:hypothetical protein
LSIIPLISPPRSSVSEVLSGFVIVTEMSTVDPVIV